MKPDGTWVESQALHYTMKNVLDAIDIANVNGLLFVILRDGSSNQPRSQNSSQSLGKFIPAGSYQRTSRNVRVSIFGICQLFDGSWETVQQPLQYSSEQAQQMKDICNIDGQLTAVYNVTAVYDSLLHDTLTV